MLYLATPFLISFAVLIAAILLFFVMARGRYIEFGIAQAALRAVAALPLAASAVVLHFMRTSDASAMLPPIFSAPHVPGLLVISTGIFEILGAVGLFVPRTRHSAALWIAILMVMVFPANVVVAGQTFGGLQMPRVPVRLVIQVIYIWIVLVAGYGLPVPYRPAQK